MYRFVVKWLPILIHPFLSTAKWPGGPYTFLLESLEGGERWGRYSIIGLEPQLVFCQRQNQVTIIGDEEREIRPSAADPLVQLQELLSAFTPAPVAGLPAFYGGAVGFLSYDVVKKFEFLPDNASDDTGFADALFMVPGLLLVHDNLKNTLVIIALVRVDGQENLEACYGCGLEMIDKLIARLKTPTVYDQPASAAAELEVSSNLTRDDFIRMVEQGTEYVRAGDVIQVVLSQRFCCEQQLDPFTLYRALRLVNPSPYLYYLQFDDELLVGSSPELLVRKTGRTVEVRPIAGTRPRGRTDAEDQALAVELHQRILRQKKDWSIAPRPRQPPI